MSGKTGQTHSNLKENFHKTMIVEQRLNVDGKAQNKVKFYDDDTVDGAARLVPAELPMHKCMFDVAALNEIYEKVSCRSTHKSHKIK